MKSKIDDIISRGKTPILVGGTGLYIKSVLYNYEFKEEKASDYSNFTNQELYQKLLEVDPTTLVHPNNRKRVERALTYYENHSEPMSLKKKSDVLLYDTVFIGLTTDREDLYKRIDTRVDKMLVNGLLDEAKNIYDTGIRTKAVLTPIGYKELFPYFENKKELRDCIEEIKKNSRHYAKRQYTFFNHQLPVIWFDVDYNNFLNTINDVMKYIDKIKNQ